MDTYSSGEDLVIKTRKPYTITKQREPWTEEEHDRFLEALKLYGRAWQRIEEHIGTKTAVQIRSHAQKFFSKLEKEALVIGIPIGQALGIDFPPPRPKRKPSNPYPRKTGVRIPTSQVGPKDGEVLKSVSSVHCKQVSDLDKEPPPEKCSGDDKLSNCEGNEEDNCSEVFTLLQEADRSSLSSPNKSSVTTATTLRNSCRLREFIPSLQEVISLDETNESFVTTDFKANLKQTVKNDGTSKVSNLENHNEKCVQDKKSNDLRHVLPTEEMQAAQSNPRNVPVQILDGSRGICAQTSDFSPGDAIFHPRGNVHGHPNPFAYPTASGTTEHHNNSTKSSVHQSIPSFHPPFTAFCHSQEEYQSFLHVSSAFSSLIVSTLLQNPAAHAAANFAATFWPHRTTGDSPACSQESFQSGQMNSAPSMAAIVGATVAAATAWWAAHGLMPVCAPLKTAFTCTPASTTAVQSMDVDQTQMTKSNRREEDTTQNPPLHDKHLDPESTEALQALCAPSKSPIASSYDSEESGGAKLSIGSKPPGNVKAAAVTEMQDSDMSKNRKPVDRSSCGSNTSSSSDVETDALEKNEKVNDEPENADANHLAADSINRRIRSISNLNDSWKEVSEEGRLAFRALFRREVLPQSFSPPHNLKNKEDQKNCNEENHNACEKNEETHRDDKNRYALLLDLNSKTRDSCSDHEEEKTVSTMGDKNGEEGLLTVGLELGNFRTRRTGFKPYKRCSVEIRENRLPDANRQGEEKGPKRIRLDGEASM